MQQINKWLFVASLLLICWLLFQAIHELGHVWGAWITAGHVEKVVLDPLSISRTDVSPNPKPLLVVWSGPIVGVLVPWLIMQAIQPFSTLGAFVLRFFAGLCCIANGSYIGIGSFEGIGDAGVMLQNGSALLQLWLFGLVCIFAGFWLWHGLGPMLGWSRLGVVSPTWTVIAVLSLIAMAVLEIHLTGE